jgi:hypothetical protein
MPRRGRSRWPMAGFRPAYYLQIISAPASQVIVAVDLDSMNSDRGLARHGLKQPAGWGIKPRNHLVDGGFAKNEDIGWADAGGAAPNRTRWQRPIGRPTFDGRGLSRRSFLHRRAADSPGYPSRLSRSSGHECRQPIREDDGIVGHRRRFASRHRKYPNFLHLWLPVQKTGAGEFAVDQ